jgi:hypothetical protein
VPPDPYLFLRLALLIDFAGGLVVAACACHGFFLVIMRRIAEARSAVARGAVAGLSFKTAGTVLAFLGLRSWNAIASFAAILAMRLVLKRIFIVELSVRSAPAGPGGGVAVAGKRMTGGE